MEAAWFAYLSLKRRTAQDAAAATSPNTKASTDQTQFPPTPPRTPSDDVSRRRQFKAAQKFNIGGTQEVDFSRSLNTSVVKGKTAIVLDGANGLGFGIATALAENGAYVAMCDPNEEIGHASEKALNDKGYRSKYFVTETSSWASQSEAFKQVLAWSGNKLDIVVTSAGIVTNNLLMHILPKHREPEQHPAKPPTNVLEIDLIGVYFSASLALFYFNRLHVSRKASEFQPQIVFICSMAGVSLPPHDI